MLKLNKGWLTQKISTEQHSVADQITVEIFGKLCSAEWCKSFHSDFEPKPGAIRKAVAAITGEALLRIPGSCMGGQGEFQNDVMGGQPPAQGLPVLLAGLDGLRQPPQVHPANCRLGIEGLEIEAEVPVGVLVVATLRQFPRAA